MHFLVDESSGASVADALRAAGHEVLFAAECLGGSSDSELLARAEADQRILVTNDKDFGVLVFRLGRAHAGIVLLRLKDECARNRARVATMVLESCGDKLAGRFTVATERGVRSRPTRSR
jgi:predicted nuclease of predicted toxin-antitoxin system